MAIDLARVIAVGGCASVIAAGDGIRSISLDAVCTRCVPVVIGLSAFVGAGCTSAIEAGTLCTRCAPVVIGGAAIAVLANAKLESRTDNVAVGMKDFIATSYTK